MVIAGPIFFLIMCVAKEQKLLRLQEHVGDLVLKDRALNVPSRNFSVPNEALSDTGALYTFWVGRERNRSKNCQISGTVHHFIKASDVNEGCDKQ